MMRRNWLGLTMVLLPVCAQPVWAENPDTGPGYGLGKLIWSDQSNQQSIAPEVLQSTANGTSGSQTFGISSGRSGCTNDGTIMAEHKVNVFAAANNDNLKQEMAWGGGEHLASLADLMDILENQRAEFFRWPKRNIQL